MDKLDFSSHACYKSDHWVSQSDPNILYWATLGSAWFFALQGARKSTTRKRKLMKKEEGEQHHRQRQG